MDYMTAAEAAAYLKITKNAIYNRVHRKQIPYMKMGQTLRFSKTALDKWLKSRAQRPLDNLSR